MEVGKDDSHCLNTGYLVMRMIVFLLALLPFSLALADPASYGTGKQQEDVSLSSKLGEEVVLQCLEEQETSCPPVCLWQGPGGVFCSSTLGSSTDCDQEQLTVTYGEEETSSCSCSLAILAAGEEHGGDWICALYRENSTHVEDSPALKKSATLTLEAGGGDTGVVVLVLVLASLGVLLVLFLVSLAAQRWCLPR